MLGIDHNRRAVASMRPGQSCPGVGFILALAATKLRRCFNEAGAIMPRSGDTETTIGSDELLASMRPGQSCPGVVRWASRGPPSTTTCFNEAGAIMPRSGP